MTGAVYRPLRVGPNKVPVYYAGGERIDRFRGVAQEGGAEDWVASVTAFPPNILPLGAKAETGVSTLADGRSLRAAIAEAPLEWLGPELAAAFGDQPGLLVKLLDAGERLPVHCHPPRAFARHKLHSQFGKTEGWIVLEADADAAMWLGFNREVDRNELWRWIEEQDTEAMLRAMNRLQIEVGDTLYVPAGVPHAFGPGLMIIELQEPTSFSIVADYRHYGLTAAQATLGLGWENALGCFDLSAYTGGDMSRLRPEPELVSAFDGGQIWRLFGVEAERFFQAYRARARGALPLTPIGGFCTLIVERGSGTLTSPAGTDDLQAGETWVAPRAAIPLELEGDVEVIVCIPPDLSER